MLSVLSDQAWKCEHPSEFSVRVSRVGSHLTSFVPNLHLDTTQQRDRVLGKMSESRSVLIEGASALFNRKPLISLDSLLIGDG